MVLESGGESQKIKSDIMQRAVSLLLQVICAVSTLGARALKEPHAKAIQTGYSV